MASGHSWWVPCCPCPTTNTWPRVKFPSHRNIPVSSSWRTPIGWGEPPPLAGQSHSLVVFSSKHQGWPLDELASWLSCQCYPKHLYHSGAGDSAIASHIWCVVHVQLGSCRYRPMLRQPFPSTSFVFSLHFLHHSHLSSHDTSSLHCDSVTLLCNHDMECRKIISLLGPNNFQFLQVS